MAVPKRLLRLLQMRDGLTCQWCGAEYQALEGSTLVPHHRRNRGFGGSVDRLSELVLVCSSHNSAFEDGLRDEPVARGFRIPRNTTVESETVLLTDYQGRRWMLTDRGTRIAS